MEIRRFFIDNSDISGDVATVRGDEFIHATKVLRYKVGFKMVLATGDGNDYLAEITEIGKDSLSARITEVTSNKGLAKKKVCLYQAVIAGGKTDLVVQKAVELGAEKVVLFYSANTTEKNVNLERMKRVALEACKQCHRAKLMEVEVLPDFKSAADAAAKQGLAIMAYEFEDKCNFRDAIVKNVEEVALIVGSEGGFTEKEVDFARNLGIKPVSLGNRILRAETAAITALSLTMYELGELSL